MLSVSATPACRVFAPEPEPCAQFNPKEISVDKSVPWFAAAADAAPTGYTMFLPAGSPCAGALTFPAMDGASKDSCALSQAVPFKEPAQVEFPNLCCQPPMHPIVGGFKSMSGMDSETEVVDFGSTTRPHEDGLLLDRSRVAPALPEVDDEVLVAFDHGDARVPVLLGSGWNTDDKPQEANEGRKRGVVTDNKDPDKLLRLK